MTLYIVIITHTVLSEGKSGEAHNMKGAALIGNISIYTTVEGALYSTMLATKPPFLTNETIFKA